uniref:Peptidase M14 domain-containing protein n=1 Tax=Strigops habroptila TaxID=2489341 RepID=A0A672THA7_STRHB
CSRVCLWDVVGILCLLSAAAALDFKYHHTEELEAYLKRVHAAYPSLTHLHSIGRSVEGRGQGAVAGCLSAYISVKFPLSPA